ncbi:unnamed protein product [Didymodactylos carnosus]|uniref:Uncharacterized protein n=1 Tax=Didymodactylos carnosus TaxID=1234261 RepID=A0A813ZHC8_9BILA|nr:unnamed protein product [Didymodactylos carnosus]CAF3681720.1 unnamed protein product [Didymodactylos carnosus]
MAAADDQMKLMFEYVMMQNIQNNSIQFDPSEFYRKASTTTPTNIDPSIIQQVLKALEIISIRHALKKKQLIACSHAHPNSCLEQHLTIGLGKGFVGLSGGSCQFIAAQFKNQAMKHSSLTPTEIEQALTSIIDNIQEYPTVNKIRVKLSYHNNGILPNSDGTRAIREKQTETVVVDEVEEEDDDEFDDNQVVEETEQRNNLRTSMGISNEQSSPPASSRNRAVSPDKRAGSTTDVRPAKKRLSSRKRTGVNG